MVDQDEKEITNSSLLLAEERRRYADISHDMNESKNRILAMLSVELAIVAYLCSDIDAILPKEIYGIIFFVIGSGCILLSISLFLFNVRAVTWPDPIGPHEIEKIKAAKSKSEANQIAAEDYAAASEVVVKILADRAKLFNAALYLFAIGAIILLILKFF